MNFWEILRSFLGDHFYVPSYVLLLIFLESLCDLWVGGGEGGFSVSRMKLGNLSVSPIYPQTSFDTITLDSFDVE